MKARIPLTLPDPGRDHFQGSAAASIKLLEYGDYNVRSVATLTRLSKKSSADWATICFSPFAIFR
jgi:hypothetical protein